MSNERGFNMKVRKVISVSLITLIIIFAASLRDTVSANRDLNLVVLANRGHQEAYAKWKPLADYLESVGGYRVNLLPYNFMQLEDALINKKVDILIVNPLYYINLDEKYKLKLISTLKTTGFTHLCGVIITRKDSNIKSLTDLIGKRIAIVSRDSAFGYLAQAALMKEHGIDIRMVNEVWSAENQDNVAYAVYNKAFDAGFLNAEVYDTLIKSKKINADEMMILSPRTEKNVPFICTTELWPNWPILVSAHVDQETTRKIQNLLLEFDKNPISLSVTYSFVPPQDYSKVKRAVNIMRGIKEEENNKPKEKKR